MTDIKRKAEGDKGRDWSYAAQIKECLELLKLKEAKKISPQIFQRECDPADTLTLDCWPLEL